MIKLLLPFPPSVNHYFRSIVMPGKNGKPRSQVLISADGRLYRQRVEVAVNPVLRDGPPLAGRLSVILTAYPPDLRKRDLDNLAKATLDALTHAGAWGDDSQIDDLRIIRGGKAGDGGRMVVEISEMPAMRANREAA